MASLFSRPGAPPSPRPCPPSALSADTESAPRPPPFSSASLPLRGAHADAGPNRPCVRSAATSSASGDDHGDGWNDEGERGGDSSSGQWKARQLTVGRTDVKMDFKREPKNLSKFLKKKKGFQFRKNVFVTQEAGSLNTTNVSKSVYSEDSDLV